jgi:hypothetical protein
MLSEMDGTSKKPRLSKRWRTAWSVAVILVFVWSLPALPSEVKPWKSLVKHVSSTTISVIGVVLVGGLLALINLNELERAWARLRHGKTVTGANSESQGLTIKAKGVVTRPNQKTAKNKLWDSDMEISQARSKKYRDASLWPVAEEKAEIERLKASEPVAESEPFDLSKVNPPPDFDPERRDYRLIMQDCDGNAQVWEPIIHALIVRTRAKLEVWNPRHVGRFDEPNVTDVTLSLMGGIDHANEMPTLRDLR